MTSRSPEVSARAAPGFRERANAEAVEHMWAADPVLVDVRPALEAVPGMTERTILTSGAPLAWDEYVGGQRSGIIGGALFQGLAADAEDADAKIRAGEIEVRICHDLGCTGSLAGIYTASMPVLVVENRPAGNRSFCNLFEGPSPQRLNYGLYNETVRESLLFLQDVVGPVLGEAVRLLGGIPLRPIIRRALHMGDELHSRNTAATLLFTRELFPALLELGGRSPEPVRQVLDYLRSSDYFFLRLSMASSKVTADAAHSFEGYTESDIEFMGGESVINETVGLGGFAQAAAFPLQDYQGGSAERMAEMNLAMYEITVGEHPEYKIPYFGFRGTPTGIDVHRVVESGITPAMDIGVAGRGGGPIGAGVLRAPLACFTAAVDAYGRRYT